MNARWALFLALCASVALNGVLLARAPSTATVATPPAPDAATAPKVETAARFGWPPAAPIEKREAGDLGAARPVPTGPVDATLQQDVLCTVAEDKLRQGWRNDREQIAESLKRSLTDNAEQAKNVTDNATHIADEIGLPADQRATFIERYREKRMARIAEAYAALARQPSDYPGLYGAVRGLFADEDALALELASETGRERLRVADLESRTTLLAIAAAMADAPFESLSW